MEEEKNYIYYDESYLAPGFLILNKRNGEINKFIKFYNQSLNGFPIFAIRAYSREFIENPDNNFNSIEFTFREIEDNENGLYNTITNLCNALSSKVIYSIDYKRQGKNNFYIKTNGKVTTITFSKDAYHGENLATDFIDIILGDDCTCEKHYEFLKFYESLSKICTKEISYEETKKLLLTK